MDFRTQQVIAELTRNIARLEERLERTERAAGTPQLPNSSLTNAAIRMVDADGTDRGSIGYQPDGTVAIVPTNGPPPPKPSTPGVAAAQLSLAIAWDGLFAEGDDGDPATQPLDFDHVQVHLSTTVGYTPDATTLQGSLMKPGSVVITPLSDESTFYAVLVPVNTSGITGEASDATPGTPDPVVSGEVLDGSITTLKLADDAVTAAKIAAAAVGTTEIADNAVTTPKVVAGAIQTAQLDAGAVNAGKIAAGAVTTAKLDALAVTAANIAANAVTAGKINAGAVTAGTIAAGAVTASKLEATMVVATELKSTNYVAGTSGWRIGGGAGDAEFNDADFRGDVTVGTATHPQVHIYTDVNTGKVDILSGDVAENDPGRLVGGTFGSGTTRSLETNLFGPRVGSSNRAFIAMDSVAVDGSGSPLIRLGQATPSLASDVWFAADKDKILFNVPASASDDGSKGSSIFFIGPQPTTTLGSWAAYSGTTWSQLPLSLVCPPSESMRITIRAIMSNRSTVAASIGMSVRVRDATTGTNLYVPSSGDSLDGASVQATGTVLGANQLSTWVAYAGANLLNGRAGHTIEFLPYYRLSGTLNPPGPAVDTRTSITVECLINKVANGTI